MSVLDVARLAVEHGYSVLPVKGDGSKSPLGTPIPRSCDNPKCVAARANNTSYGWTHWQHAAATAQQVDRWFHRDGNEGIGVVCGAASRGLEMFEFEGRAVADGMPDRFDAACRAQGLGDLWERVVNGYCEITPSGGLHLLYRCDKALGNIKLAKDAEGEVLIETRGEGGYTVIAPSHGATHPSGKAWVIQTGSIDTVAEISDEERDQLHDIARTFNRFEPQKAKRRSGPVAPKTKQPKAESPVARRSEPSWMDRIVAEYNAKTTWPEVLAGVMEHHHQSNGIDHWTVLGADNTTGATTNATGTDRLTVFSGTAEKHGFTAHDGTNLATTYDRFSAHVVLETGGNDVDARIEVASALAEVADPGGSAAGKSGRYFRKTGGLKHRTLREAVLAHGPIARGPGGALWQYADGVWLSDGADEVRRRVSRLLDERHRKGHADGIVADLAAREPFITDEQPTRYINCQNGLLHWRTGKLRPHTPKVPTTYQLSVEWDPDATCPTVDRWMRSVLPDDAMELAWEVIGTAIYADQPFHRAVLLLGPGRNGKGTFLRLVTALIGQRHVSNVTLQSLGDNRFAAAELFGKVANICGDLDARSIQRTDQFKMATGGDSISAERKYGAPFSFRNRATMIFSANEAPGTSDHTEGFFARWVVMPFTRLQLAPGEEDPSIEREMHDELCGVLVQAIDGLRRAMSRGGFSLPPSVLEATTSYRDNADPLRRFLEDTLEVTGNRDDKVMRSTVYGAYRQWCEENGNRPLSANRYWSRLRAIDDRINTDRVINGARYVDGVRQLENRP